LLEWGELSETEGATRVSDIWRYGCATAAVVPSLSLLARLLLTVKRRVELISQLVLVVVFILRIAIFTIQVKFFAVVLAGLGLSFLMLIVSIN